MLDRLDRMLVAVHDCAAAADTFSAVLGAEKVHEDEQPHFAAKRTVMRAGDSDFDLMEPAGDGAIAEHLESRGEGLFGAGFSTPDLDDIARSLDATGLGYSRAGDDVHIAPDQTRGMRTVIRKSAARQPAGVISYVYEVTNIVDDHQDAAAFYAKAFGLDASRFSPIDSEVFGYTGTLTLVDPPARLDRIEITQITEPSRAMGRYYARRGQSIYMCFVETPDVGAIQARLESRESRFESFREGADWGLFIHPSALHGILMGVSLTNVAWRWSGRPELAPRRTAPAS